MTSADLAPTSEVSALARHVRDANPAVLTAALAAITGDVVRSREFLPHLTHSIHDAAIVAALPEPERARLTSWALEVLPTLATDGLTAHHRLSDEDFADLASGLVGWRVDAESSRFFKEQAGFTDFVEGISVTPDKSARASLIVIGAGMAGIAAAVAAKKVGIPFTVLEKSAAVGGVWRKNDYPGVGVDTPSAYYSFSFEVNDQWSGRYPKGGEYLDYLHRVTEKYGVLDSFVFGAQVSSLVWDESNSNWQVTYDRDGQITNLTASFVLTAAGYLTRPQLPNVPGLDSFQGEWFHSAEWNHGYDFVGKRLAVVGTGCTSVQVVDALADQVTSLTLVQRQPHWVLPPSASEKFDESELWLNANVPTYAMWGRLLTFLPISDVNYPVVRYDAEWAQTHDLSISSANHAVLELALDHLESTFADRPDLVDRLKPNFAPFGKRTIRDPGRYYEILKRENSTVVPGLSEVVSNGLIDGEGVLHEVDVIVYATGFTLEYLASVAIVGRGGQRLADRWADSPVAYNGCQVPGFPNLFISSGPNASAAHGGGHNFTVEATIHYVMEAIRTLVEHDSSTVEATPEAMIRWKHRVDELMADSVWARERRATTYYRNAKGEVVLASPLTMEELWSRLRGLNPEDVVISA